MRVGPRKAMMDVLGSDEDALEAALGLGELAGLTVTNEADAYDVGASDTQYKHSFHYSMQPSYRLHFASCLSVCLSICPVRAHNLKTQKTCKTKNGYKRPCRHLFLFALLLISVRSQLHVCYVIVQFRQFYRIHFY